MDSDDHDSSGFSAEVGARLRAVRRAKSLSLDDVERLSGGKWSASAIGAYERGFRNLSLPRLRELASFFEVPMVVLLGEIDGLDGVARQPVAVDLDRLKGIPEANPAWRYLQSILRERGEPATRTAVLRLEDVRSLCAVLRLDEPSLAAALARWGVLSEPAGVPAGVSAAPAPAPV
jgi:transcriptional regulator with XRE-family HTH domain